MLGAVMGGKNQQKCTPLLFSESTDAQKKHREHKLGREGGTGGGGLDGRQDWRQDWAASF